MEILNLTEREIIEKEFASYCCIVLKHALIDYYRMRQREIHRNAETISMDELSLFEQEKIMNDYYRANSNEHSFWINSINESVIIRNDKLAQALKHIPCPQRDYLLMYFILGMNDDGISTYVGTSRQNVNQQRKKAYVMLTNLLKKECEDGE